jgi:SAM-dependent methyltransferase
MRAADRWSEALAAWAIPEQILAQAPVAPWVHPPAMFRLEDADVAAMPSTPSFRLAAQVLRHGGSVLDVGCGGGRSSIPLGSARVTHLTGVDEQQAMLAQFADAARTAGIPVDTVEGRWPDAADRAPVADLVVCHHVAYNVADIGRFVRELDGHARRRVVVELPDRHPTLPFNPLWQRFWGLDRPSEPSADLFVAVVREETGATPLVERWRRPSRREDGDRAEYVAFVRTRLCLTADRDPEVAAALEEIGPLATPSMVTVAWAPAG